MDAKHTRVDELERLAFEIAFFLDPLLEGRNLSCISTIVEVRVAGKGTVSDGSASSWNLFCLRS